jgi:hypothetical protein
MAVNLDIDRPLPESAQRGISSLLGHADGLAEILASTVAEPPKISAASTFRTIATTLGVDFAEVARIFGALENLSVLREELGSTDAVLNLLEKRLNTDIAERLRPRVGQIKAIIESYIASHPVAISLKAEKLSYLHETLLQDAEIITDVRPVFNADGTKILEMVATHSLIISAYSPGTGSRRLHFALDAADVLKLRRICDRAIVKADSIKRELGGMPWITRVLNDEPSDG